MSNHCTCAAVPFKLFVLLLLLLLLLLMLMPFLNQPPHTHSPVLHSPRVPQATGVVTKAVLGMQGMQ
jgi:beta-lactam-binding protein with PASTA domain